ncbi:MAG: efflux RND transporter periplasmic adaptor subunit [Longimicrobiales bacterium]|nr:efflux RND transporter periplasmic adaptor subunit [Longimicrobiales bacterium]
MPASSPRRFAARPGAPRGAPRPTSSALPATLGLLLAMGACSGDGEAAQGGVGTAAAAVPVEIAVARTDTVLQQLRAVGSLEAAALVTVKSESSGRVLSLEVREGSRVEAGAVLLQLDAAKLQAEFEVAEAAAARAETESENLARQLERNRSLLAQGAISPQAFDDIEAAARSADARLREARAALSLARERLEDATVRAPFSGEVGLRSIDLGAYVEDGDDLFQLVDNDPLEIAFPVPERYLGAMQLGARVELQVRNFPDRRFAGEVVFMSPLVDPVNRTVTVKARVANPDRVLRSGQFADVRMELGRRPDAIVIPEAAIVPGRADDAVFVVREGVVTRRSVTVGSRSGGEVEVVEGLAAGDTVVVAGQQRLSDGAAVRVEVGG